MKKLFQMFLLMTALLLSSVPVFASEVPEDRAWFPPVLMYHDVKAVADNYFDVTAEDFRAQLDLLQQQGYTTLSMEEFTDIVKSGEPFPEKSVLITFDDGYRGVYDFAAPELKKRGMKATFFIIADAVQEGFYITAEEIKELAADPLFSIGSHTLSHPHLDQLDADQQKAEIKSARKKLASLTGRRIDALAFPYGAYDKWVIKATQKAGYKVSFAVQDRGLVHEPARYTIPRICMGVELGKDHLDRFLQYVESYREMPAALFVDRFEPFEP